MPSAQIKNQSRIEYTRILPLTNSYSLRKNISLTFQHLYLFFYFLYYLNKFFLRFSDRVLQTPIVVKISSYKWAANISSIPLLHLNCHTLRYRFRSTLRLHFKTQLIRFLSCHFGFIKNSNAVASV